jgi:exonuclease III
MMEDSDYQLGKPRMKLPVKERSTQKDVNKCLQAEEMRKTVAEATCNVVALQESLVKYSGSNSKLLRIRGYVFTFNSKKKKLEGLQVATRKEGHLAHSSSSPEMLHTTEDFLVGKGLERKGNKRKETSMGLEPSSGRVVGV